jgi:hypothetical protein
MSVARTAGNMAASMILLAGIGLMATGAYAMHSSGIIQGTWNSFWYHAAQEFRTDADPRKQAIVQQNRDIYYVNICPAYFESSWIGKAWENREIAWCEDYADKMGR